MSLDNFVLNGTLSPAGIDVRWSVDGSQVLIRNSTALDGIRITDGVRYTIVQFSSQLVNGTDPIPVSGIQLSPDSE